MGQFYVTMAIDKSGGYSTSIKDRFRRYVFTLACTYDSTVIFNLNETVNNRLSILQCINI